MANQNNNETVTISKDLFLSYYENQKSIEKILKEKEPLYIQWFSSGGYVEIHILNITKTDKLLEYNIRENQKEIDANKKELESIKSKWWYKLFA